jgi:uncharacterized protein YmfQ (DUF2313 family)
MLKRLLPPGVLLSLEPSSDLSKTMTAVADELARIDARGVDLLNETNPRTATETLEDWEAMVGLPDAQVTTISADPAIRRTAIVQKVVNRGGQSVSFYQRLCAACGYYFVSITKGSVMRAGFRVNDRCYGAEFAYSMTLAVEDRPVTISHADFERVIRHATHSHVQVMFIYY